MPRLFKRSHRYNVAKNTLLARIILLDSTAIEINPLPEVTGTDCLEKVAQTLDIQEISYFGLQFRTKSETMRWVERDKSLRRQLEKHAIFGVNNAELRFRVQYYVTSVTKLEFEVTRYLYFLQLKHLILNGDLQCSHDIAVKLASYALQAEFGDHDDEKHTPDFLSDYVFLPPNVGPPSVIKSLTERASKQHQRHRGMSPPSAELMYIKIAQQLPEYGHEAFQTLDIHGSTIWIGASFIGVFVKHSNGQPTIYFKWPDIYRMKVRDKNFGIETPSETVYFKMPDNSTAQYVMRLMIRQHKFFVSELEGTAGISWMSDRASSRSRSAHDLRSTSSKRPDSVGKAAATGSEKKSKFRKLFHPPFFKESGRLSASRRRAEELSSSERAEHHPLHTSNGAMHSHTFSAPVRPIVQSPSHSSNSHKSPLPPSPTTSSPHTSPLHTTTIATIEEHPSHETPPTPTLRSRSVSPSPHVAMAIVAGEQDASEGVKGSRLGSPLLSKLSPLLGGKKGRVRTPTLTLTNGGLDGDTGSQESFDMRASLNKKKKFTGSLDQLETRTPPKSLRIRNFSSEEQAEQEAASGTHDRRGDTLEKRLSQGDFYSEYEELATKSHDSDINAGQLPENIPKNRYKDILPYKETRVRLNPDNNTSHNDYINASYVDVPYQDATHHYIVAQGPLEHTCADFWQMIWEKRIQIVVMLTNEWEGGRCKCHRYFPLDKEKNGESGEEGEEGEYVQFEQYRISRIFINRTEAVVNRGLQLKHIPTGEEREVMHLQYVDWPDHGIPDDPQPFLNFLEEVRSLRLKYNSSIPILLHCSAGVGRSGVVVLVDRLMGLVDSGEKDLDIPVCLLQLRNQRMHLVQMVGQYKFVYTAIVQYIRRARLI